MIFKKVSYKVLLNKENTGYYLEITYDKNSYSKIYASIYYTSSKNKKIYLSYLDYDYNMFKNIQDTFKALIEKKVVKRDKDKDASLCSEEYFKASILSKYKYFYLGQSINNFTKKDYTDFVTQFPELFI